MDQLSRSAEEIEKIKFLQRVRGTEVDIRGAPEIYREFVEFLDARNSKPAHYVRYCQTFLAMVPYLDMLPGRVVVETGSFCDITLFLKSKGFACRKTSTDLRCSLDVEDDTADLLLSLEVIEHLKDIPERNMTEIVLFQQSGVRQYAEEVKRVLRPGGLLILTTPNPCSVRALELLVNDKAPMIFRAHVREYTKSELLEIFDGLENLKQTTHFSFFHLTGQTRNKWLSIFKRNGWGEDGRGDDHFMVFRKPA